MSYIQAIPPVLNAFSKTGEPLEGGKLVVLEQTSRLPLTVYADAAGTVAYPNGVPLTDAGQIPTIYWDDTKVYYLNLTNSLGVTVKEVQNFIVSSGSGGGGDITITTAEPNLINNGQFSQYEQALWTTAPTAQTLIAPDYFYFDKDGDDGTDTLSFNAFTLDATVPSSTPTNYLKYTCTVAAVGETYKDVIYQIQDVRAMQNTSVSLSIGAIDLLGNSPSLIVQLEQYFGTGGNPSAANTQIIGTIQPTTEWVDYPFSFVIDSLADKTLGTNGDDTLSLVIRMPLNQTSSVGLTNIYFKEGTVNTTYPYQTPAQVNTSVLARQFPTPVTGDVGKILIASASSYNSAVSMILDLFFPIGTMIDYPLPRSTMTMQWFKLCDGSSLPRAGFYSTLATNMGLRFTVCSGLSVIAVDSTSFQLVCDIVGTASSPASSNPAISVSIITPGTTSVRQVVALTVNESGSSFSTGDTLRVVSPQPSSNMTCGFFCTFIVDDDSAGFSYTSADQDTLVLIPILSSMTAEEVTTRLTTILSSLVPNGIASNDNFTATVSSNIVTVNCLKIGQQKSSPSAGTTNFTVTAVSDGSETTYAQTTIATTAVSEILSSAYFTISTLSYTIAVWFIIDDVGSEPTDVTADFLVPVSLSSSQSESDVATALQQLLHYVLMAIPNAAGVYFRGYSPQSVSGTVAPFTADDPNERTRVPGSDSTDGDDQYGVGTYEFYNLQKHTHTISQSYYADTGSDKYSITDPVNSIGVSSITIAPTGSGENRPKNFAIDKYMRVY